MREFTPSSTNELIAALWQRNRPQVLERLALLDLTAAAASSGTLTATLHEEALAIAHKLAGSLGMFGFHEGTRLARQLENLLDATTSGPGTPDPAAITALAAQLRASLFPPG